jgi:HD-GYP domain-containing protein (c-di-GMP phosphodiesterase class II)
LTAASSIVERISRLDFAEMGPVTVSAGIALAPQHARERDELLRLVDTALYRAKENGKNRADIYRPDVIELADLRRLVSAKDRAARLRAAASLASAVDARDVYAGNHSERVAELAVRLAARIGLSREELELTRLAGSLHDLGKLVLPEKLLRKPEPLTEPEWTVLREHSSLGSRMLESLGIDSVAEWVLHHHERWDGKGYPDGLAGTDIPLGARIIFVADSFDAITSDGLYGKACTVDDALTEVVLCAGTQFDPAVVEALAAELHPAAHPEQAVAV